MYFNKTAQPVNVSLAMFWKRTARQDMVEWNHELAT
jgi:hypothetical protein